MGDFVHVEDVGRASIMALQKEEIRKVSINIGSGTSFSVNEVAEIIDPGKERKRLPERRNDLPGTLANLDRAKEVLGFQPQKDFPTEIKRQMSWDPNVVDNVN